MKRYLIAGIFWGLAVLPFAHALEQPVPYTYWHSSADLDVRETQLKHIVTFWEDSGKGLREPSPKLLEWYQREAAFYQEHFFEDPEKTLPRVSSFLDSEEYAHVQLYYATQRIETVLGAIANTQEKGDPEKELFAWIALTAETQRCQELIELANDLLWAEEIGSSTQQSIEQFCRLAPLRLHRSIILPMYQQLYIE